MNTLNFALSLLKKEYKKNISYGVILILSIVICFIFTDFAGNKNLISTDRVITYAGTWEGADVPLSSALPFIIICICWIMILSVSNYYLNQKNREFALILISGGGQLDVAKYVLYQVAIILCLAIPVALTIATFMLIQIYSFMYDYLDINVTYSIPISTYINTIISLVPIFAAIVISIAGFAHKNSIQILLGRAEKLMDYKVKKSKSRSFLYFILYIFGVVFIITQKHLLIGYIIATVIGVFSMYGLIKQTIPKVVQVWKNNKGIEKKHAFISFSNYSISLQGTIFLITIMLSLVSALIPVLITQNHLTNEYLTGVISYIVIVILIIVGLICKFVDNIVIRKQEFINMSRIGYNHTEIIKIIRYEVLAFYISILLLPLPYMLLIGIKYVVYDALAINVLILLLLIYIIPTILSMFITYRIYIKTVIVQVKGKR